MRLASVMAAAIACSLMSALPLTPVVAQSSAATDNERLEAEGRNDQDEARLKSAGDKIKDAAQDVKRAF